MDLIDMPDWWLEPPAASETTVAALLKATTQGELLQTSPTRYVHIQAISDPSLVPDGTVVSVAGQVVDAEVSQTYGRGRPRPIFNATVQCANGSVVHAKYFLRHPNQARYHESRLFEGAEVVITGKVSRYRGEVQLTHPDVVEAASAAVEPTIEPHYRGLSGPKDKEVSACLQAMLADKVGNTLDDWVPPGARKASEIPDIATALRYVHAPQAEHEPPKGRRRLAFEQAYEAQLLMLQRRERSRALTAVGCPPRAGGLLERFDNRLPFALTDGQRDVGRDLCEELADTAPMNRLLQGDVGSGKTLVAIRAMLQVVDSGGQCAFLAPTEVLATQHYRSLHTMLGPLAHSGLLGGEDGALTLTLLTGSMKTAAKRRALADVASGEAGIVVGTHALLQDNVQFADLRFVVIDEQHRFGVAQREALRKKATTEPHMLVMTATPIPRTVALTVFGDLDTSLLKELPAGRQPVQTHIVPVENETWRARVWQRLREEVDAGRQAFVVVPRVDAKESEYLDQQNMPTESGGMGISEAVNLVVAETGIPFERIGVLHGKLPSDEKDDVMSSFAEGTLSVLVATTVIEVGVDVPNASTMAIIDAHHFGIAQLHQLRGRIGRGGLPGICFLMTSVDVPETSSSKLDAIAATTDGFELADVDTILRQEGDVLGMAQSGRETRLDKLSVVHDARLITAAREAAAEMLRVNPDLTGTPNVARAVAALGAGLTPL